MRIKDELKEERKNRSFTCEKCGHSFTFAWNLRQHLKHSKNCGTSEEEFKCINCGKKFTLNATLKQHFARCIAVDPHRFECNYCNRKFTYKSSLRKHLRARCPNMHLIKQKPKNEEYPQLEEVSIHELDIKNMEIIIKQEGKIPDDPEEFQTIKSLK